MAATTRNSLHLVEVPVVAHGPDVGDELVGHLVSASSVISSFCLPISCSSRSNGPVKLVSVTWKPVGAAGASAGGSGDGLGG